MQIDPTAITMKPYAMWTDDCHGKKDFDGPIISVSTRYWPRFGPFSPRPSANSSILLRVGPQKEHDGGGDYLVWRKCDFEGDTEADVKAQVEAWVEKQMDDIVALLGGTEAFTAG